MATLKAMFKLFDGYTSTIQKINKKTDEATNKILRASGCTDKFNNGLKQTGSSAGFASNKLGKLLSVTALVAGAIKGMNIADNFINTSSRLELINDGLQTQAELQNKIFKAANDSKGAYTSMASAVSKMGLMAKESFSTNDELIAFTELIQKGFKVGGASQTEQSSAMLQLTQAMGAGRLQGDEFRSIMENAPMIADAIAKYVGVSKGELKKMSAEGTITADIIKNSIFMSSDDINKKFKTMPMTFADVWNRIKNSGLQAFDKVIVKINKLINTESFNNFINNISIGLNILSIVIGWVIDNLGLIIPMLAVIGGTHLVIMVRKLWAMVPPLYAQVAAWITANWSILLIVGTIILVVKTLQLLGVSFEDILGFVGGIIGVFVTFFYNKFVYMWNIVASFVNFFANVFKNPVASIKILFLDLTTNVLGFIETMAQGIEDLINKIPGVEIDITSGLTNFKDKIAKESANIKSKSEWEEVVKSKVFMDYSEGYSKGNSIGKKVAGKISNSLESLIGSMSPKKGTGINSDSFGTNNPMTVKGTSSNGSIDVSMADEDLQYLRDIAERDYINKFSTATLAPNISVSFGDVYEEADANKVAGRIKKILQEEIAVTAEGVYCG